MLVGMAIGIFVGFILGFTACALVSANKINGEVYYIDMYKSDNKDEEDNEEGDEDDE